MSPPECKAAHGSSREKWEALTFSDNQLQKQSNHSGLLWITGLWSHTATFNEKVQRLHSAWPSCCELQLRMLHSPQWGNPPAFPPFLHLMKTRGEDIRPSISRNSTSHMFWWISAHVLSPASSGDRAAEPYQHSSEDTVNETTWAVADRLRLDTGEQHLSVRSCDILRSQGLDCLHDHDHML